MTTAASGRDWSDDELAAALRAADVPFRTPDDLSGAVANILETDGIVAWFDGRRENGSRGPGSRSLMAHPRHAANLERLPIIDGRQRLRPVAAMVLAERAGSVLTDGPLPSTSRLSVHQVAPAWRARMTGVVQPDGTAQIQTVDDATTPLVAAVLGAFESRSGLPVLATTSLDPAGGPTVDTPREALDLFGSAPLDALVLGPHLVRRSPHPAEERA